MAGAAEVGQGSVSDLVRVSKFGYRTLMVKVHAAIFLRSSPQDTSLAISSRIPSI
jgi:hypothetical protein